MAELKKQNIAVAWIMTAIMLSLGPWLIVHLSQSKPEAMEDLVQVGPAVDVEQSYIESRKGGHTDLLSFNISGTPIANSSKDPKFLEVTDAVKSGEKLHAWVTRHRRGWTGVQTADLYRLDKGNQTILSYEDTVKKLHDDDMFLMMFGFGITAFGIFCLVVSVKETFFSRSKAGGGSPALARASAPSPGMQRSMGIKPGVQIKITRDKPVKPTARTTTPPGSSKPPPNLPPPLPPRKR